MKKIILSVMLLSATAMMSFTTANTTTTSNSELKVTGKIQVKIKNDTGADHKVITSSGGSTSVPDQSGATTVTVEVGDDIFLYDGGKKGAKLMSVTSDMDGKTFKLSDLM